MSNLQENVLMTLKEKLKEIVPSNQSDDYFGSIHLLSATIQRVGSISNGVTTDLLNTLLEGIQKAVENNDFQQADVLSAAFQRVGSVSK